MTVATGGGGGAVSPYGDFADDIGLEDVDATDMAIPRLRIIHAEGVFQDNLSGQKMATLRCVLLGLVKQRIMWHKEVDDDDLPMCKSPDHKVGFPLITAEKQPRDKFFPWDKSNFDQANFPPAEDGLVRLPCEACVFAKWNAGDWKQPPCSEQHTFPLFYTPDEGQTWQPGLLTLQKTGIKPSKQYISGFASARRPLFTFETNITLDVNKRGQVTFSVPKLVRGEETNRDNWSEYGQSYFRVRDLIQSAPRGAEEGGATAAATDASASNENTPPPAAAAASAPPAQPPAAAQSAPAQPAAAPVAAAPSAPPAAPVVDDADDMPF